MLLFRYGALNHVALAGEPGFTGAAKAAFFAITGAFAFVWDGGVRDALAGVVFADKGIQCVLLAGGAFLGPLGVRLTRLGNAQAFRISLFTRWARWRGVLLASATCVFGVASGARDTRAGGEGVFGTHAAGVL